MLADGTEIVHTTTGEKGIVVATHPVSRWPYTVALVSGKRVLCELEAVKAIRKATS